jgi:hypothetical protein
VKYNQNYLTSATLFTEAGITRLDIRVTDIANGEIVASAGANEGSLKTIHQTAIDEIRDKLDELKIVGVILPSVKQLKEGEIRLFPSKPQAGSIISSDLSLLTPASILENEINKLSTPKNIPTEETVLSSETAKSTVSESSTSLKSLPIENSVEVPKTTEAKSAESEVRSTPIPTVKPEPVESVKIVTVPVEVERAAPLAATVATSGNVTQAAVSPITTTNITSNTVNKTGESIATATEKEITKALLESTNSVSKTTDVSQKSTNSIIKDGSTLLKELSSTKETSQKSTIEKVTSPEDLILSSFGSVDFMQGLIKEGVKFSGSDNILKAANEKKESLASGVESGNSKISSEVASLKTSKLADSNSVKQLLTPDKTLERSVRKLTKDLPESINNLNSSFSNFSPQSSSTATVTNEGAKIDQSSTVNSMQPNNRQVSQPETASPQANSQTGMNQSDFYMQAIYAALMSGKIRVKLEQL